MARKISFSKEYKPKNTERLPKLTLDSKEKARIALLGDMEAEFVHNLTKVEIDEDTGKAVMEVKEGNNGNTWESPATKFLGRLVCSGDFDTVQDRQTDGENCALCRAAEESAAFTPPTRYMVQMVLQYETKPGTHAAQLKPFQARVLPWMFTNGKWNILAAIDEEYEESGGVMGRDLLLGPCKSKAFQLYDIAAASGLAYKGDDRREEQVQELLEAYEGDVTTLFGKRGTEGEIKRYLAEIQDTYDAAFSPTGGRNDSMRSSSSKAVDNLFGEDTNEYSSDDDDDNEDAGGVKNLSDLIEF